MKRLSLQLIAAALACYSLWPALAADVHKWVDEQGVTHYSDEAPEAIETTLIDLPDPVIDRSGSGDGDDYYSISRQWERMNRERLERERLEVERARIRAELKSSEAPPVYVKESASPRYIPLIFHDPPYRKHFGHRRHYRSSHEPGIRRPMPAPQVTGGFPTQ
jgi:hypothetical protein